MSPRMEGGCSIRGCDDHGRHRVSASHLLDPPPAPPTSPHHQSLGQLRLRGWMGAGEEVTTRLRVKMGVPRQQRAFLSLALPSTFSGLESGDLGSLLTWQLAPRGPQASPTPLGPQCPSPPGREADREEVDLPGLACQRTLPLRLRRLRTSRDRICMQVMCRCALAQSTGCAGVYE